MHRTVRSHLILVTLAVSLASIFIVSLVTFLLVNRYFNGQEHEYLEERSRELREPLESVLRDQRHNLQQMASLGLLSSRVRVRVFDNDGGLLADSGTLRDLASSVHIEDMTPFPDSFQFYIDEYGRVQSFNTEPPMRRFAEGFVEEIQDFDPVREIFPAIDPAPQAPISEFSETSLRLPLHLDGDVVAVAELSEGPAFGTIVRHSYLRAIAIAGALAAIFAMFAGILAARRVTKPLKALGIAADEMADGNLDARAPNSNLIEFGRLAIQFNGMADHLSESIADLEADRAALRRFIADASHELRTPLTALTTFNELLARDSMVRSEPASSFIVESKGQLAKLDRITTDLLDLSRFEARLSGTDLQLGDLRTVILGSTQGMRVLSEAKDQRLQVDMPQEPVLVKLDELSLEKAMSNLIDNAIKHSPMGGLISVTLSTEKSDATLVIHDSGAGIAENELDLIFDRFHRGADAETDGSGLGLSIAKEIINIHGGEISAKNEVGGGSSFTVRVPLADADETEEK